MQARLLGDVTEISRHTSTQTGRPQTGTRRNVLSRHLDDVTLSVRVALTQSRAVDDGVERECRAVLAGAVHKVALAHLLLGSLKSRRNEGYDRQFGEIDTRELDGLLRELTIRNSVFGFRLSVTIRLVLLEANVEISMLENP